MQAEEVVAHGFTPAEVAKVQGRLESTHWKRRLPTVAVMSQTAIGEFYLRRSEEHTSELQSQSNLVCRLLLEKKKKKTIINYSVKIIKNCILTTQKQPTDDKHHNALK